MRNLRQLLRRSGLLSSDQRRRRLAGVRRGDATTRRLGSEVLEKRQLLAGDILASHNLANPYDVNSDGRVSARDALGIVNYLASNAEGELLASSIKESMFYDVNADSNVSAADALSVINAMGRAEAADEDVELLLTARDLDDNLIPRDNTGDVNVQVGERFKIEVAYDDLRLFNAQKGVFQLFVDLGVSQPGVLSPVLNETQRLIVDEALLSTPADSVTFSIPEAPPGVTGGQLSYESPIGAFGSNTRGEVVNALQAFGYDASEFEVSSLDFGNNDIGFQVHWIGDQFGNVNLPNISVEVNETNAQDDVATETIEFAPFLADGTTPNPEAVRFNLDTFSRTFNDNERFYTAQNRGTFDSAVGFTGVGGLGMVPTEGGGIPELTDDGSFDQPFDAFALTVFVNQPVTDLVVDVNPGEDPEATLLYGRDDPLPQDKVLVETIDMNANGIGILTINATSGNVDPTVSGPLSETFTEDDGVQNVDLLTGANDGDGDTLNVAAGATISGDPQGAASISGNTLSVNTAAYGALNDGESQEITVTYVIEDGNGGSVNQSATVLINGVTDAVNNDPVVAGPVVRTFTEDDAQTNVDLLEGASDADGDTLNVANVQISGDTLNGVQQSGNFLTVTPSAYDSLDANQAATITVTYDVVDGNGGSVNQSATITINGLTDNQAPTVDNPITESYTEDDANDSVDLLLGASDPDGDTLNVANVSISGDTNGAVTQDGNQLLINPSVYGGLNDGESVQITVNYDVIDGNGGSIAQTATVTINGITDIVNQPPVVTAPITQTISEDDPVTNVSLLANASDPDGDTLSVSGAVLSGDTAGATLAGDVLTVDPNAYDALNDGETATITVNYDVIDGEGGSVSTSATITIQGLTDNRDPVVSAPISETFSEEDAAATVDLLANASDPDNDTLSVDAVTLESGDAAGVTVDGNSLSVTPDAYAGLVDGQTSVIVYSYDVVDGEGGSVRQTATVTINGFNDPPNARNDEGLFTFVNQSADFNVLANDDAGDGESGTPTVVDVTSDDGNAAVSINADGTVRVVPNTDFIGTTTFTYTIEDAQGKSDTAQASVTVQDFVPSTISGSVFRDAPENLEEMRESGADPIRNGVKDSDEPGFAGVEVNLFSAAENNSTGQTINRTVVTGLDGAYSFDNLPPGTYNVTASINGEVISDTSEKVIFLGTSQQQVSIGSEGGVNATEVNWALLGTQGPSLSGVEILASSYTKGGVGGREGGLVSLAADGEQEFFVAAQGFDGVDFAQLTLNDARDAALLTIVQDGNVKVAALSLDDFVLRDGGELGIGVQFFGGLDDFAFVDVDSADSSLMASFPQYRDNVDDYMASLGSV